MKIAIFTGPRVLAGNDVHATNYAEDLICAVVREVVTRGYRIYVGDAEGVDNIVESEAYSQSAIARVFFPIPDLGRTPAGLAERSTRMVKEALRSAAGDHVMCIGFPNKPCPAGITPAKTWRSGNNAGSGTWSTLALAVGHNIKTWIFPIAAPRFSEHAGFPDPFHTFVQISGWSQTLTWENFATNHICSAAAWHFTPPPRLFDIIPSNALCFDANDVSRYYMEGERFA